LRPPTRRSGQCGDALTDWTFAVGFFVSFHTFCGCLSASFGRGHFALSPISNVWFSSSLIVIGLLAVTPRADAAPADTATAPRTLDPVVVSPSKPGRQHPSASGSTGRAKRARTAAPAFVQAPAQAGATEAASTPLNTNRVAESASRLGLTPRETPATVEIVDRQMMWDRGIRTTTESAEAFVGVIGADPPGAPATFSIRGFSGDQINTLYNGIRVGPSNMTGRPMDTFNLDRIEVLKGPASLLSGEGATGGAINYVTKTPHTGAIVNEAYSSVDSFRGYRAGYGSGGSTLVDGLDYRFDISHSNNVSFIDDAYSKLSNVSGQLNYRISNNLKIWGAVEYKQDDDRFYWGTPLVPANAPGIIPTTGIVSGKWSQYYPGPSDFAGHTGRLNPVTIDARTLSTNYNVLDNKNGAHELWLRSGVQWDITSNVQFKSQVYSYSAQRHWFNNEINSYNDSPTPSVGAQGEIYRERLSVDHDQKLYGNISDLTVNSDLAGMDNRFVATVAASSLQFNSVQDDAFTNDTVSLVDPISGFYGFQQTKNFFTHVDNAALAFEDRLKIAPSFALLGGIRFETIELSRTAFDVDGNLRSADGYPFSKNFTPVTGRFGYTWEALPGLTFYSQYATAADPTVANIFNLRPTQPQLLTTSRTYETGIKHLFWNNRAEWTLSVFDIERRNVYVPESGQIFNVAGKIASKGVELAGAINPFGGLKLWGNVSFLHTRFVDFSFVDDSGVFQSYSGNTPPNVPSFIANAGASYRFATAWPLELGVSLRHVGDRFNFQDNLVVMDAYTVADAYAFVDIPKTVFSSVEQTRLSFRVRNLTDRRYALWGDSGYTDQIILGSPRSYEISASFKW
jgi:iron complex outermembrane receptor protein